jgi:hypothetical protein
VLVGLSRKFIGLACMDDMYLEEDNAGIASKPRAGQAKISSAALFLDGP